MLYDPKWEKQTTADPLSLESLIAWLEKQAANKSYNYICVGHCLLAQYFTEVGFNDVSMGSKIFSYAAGNDRISEPMPPDFDDVANGNIMRFKHASQVHTFGAALERARAALSQS